MAWLGGTSSTIDSTTLKKEFGQQHSTPAPAQGTAPSFGPTATPSPTETSSHTPQPTRTTSPPPSIPHALSDEMLPTPPISQNSQSTYTRVGTFSPSPPTPPWEVEEEEQPEPPPVRTLESPDLPGYQERLEKAMKRDRENLYSTMCAVMKKPEWVHLTEDERERKLEETKRAQVERRKKKGQYVSCSFPGYEKYDYKIRPGLRKRQAEQRQAEALIAREQAEEDDDEEELPLIKGEAVEDESSRHSTGLNDEEEAKKDEETETYHSDSDSESEDEYEIGRAIMRSLAVAKARKTTASATAQATSKLLRQSSASSCSASVKAERTRNPASVDRKAWQWVEKKVWTPIGCGDSVSRAPAMTSLKRSSIEDWADEGENGAGRKKVKLEDAE